MNHTLGKGMPVASSTMRDVSVAIGAACCAVGYSLRNFSHNKPIWGTLNWRNGNNTDALSVPHPVNQTAILLRKIRPSNGKQIRQRVLCNNQQEDKRKPKAG